VAGISRVIANSELGGPAAVLVGRERECAVIDRMLDSARRGESSAQVALLIAAAEQAGELPAMLRAAAKLELPQDALDPAEEIGLVWTDGAILSFRHPLVRSVVYESATSAQRARIHAALAAALEGEHNRERAHARVPDAR
jgi:hypothetical protein